MDYLAKAEQGFTNTLPTGTVTLLFSDIEGSTRLLQRLGDRYASVLTACRDLLRAALQQWNGHEVDTQGDSFFAVFARATDAVSAAVAAQRVLATHQWPDGVAVRVRIGLHTGEPERSSEGYVGLDVHYAARLMSVAHGGQVLLSQTTRNLVEHNLPEGMSLRNMGEHRLKDFRDPRYLFQLVSADLPADFPPLRTLDTQLNNLPVQLTSLIGREQEIITACTFLRLTDVRLLTLTGTGGIGKTRLGLAVATELLDVFADGVCFVPLASISDPTLVVPTIARLLGPEHMHVGQRTFVEHMEYLKTFLHDKHFLLVLDNFEQVVVAAPDLSELLVACPHLKLLVTSRAALHVQGEQEFQVPPLALPKRTQLPAIEVLTQYAAVALFLERALAIKPDFAITQANIQAIATICVHLDGLPLAIELAAARIKLLPPRALLQRLGHWMPVLTGGAQNVPARQQTLRNTIAWSYDLLDVAEQRLFRQLSVFVGGCTLETIEAIGGTFTDGEARVLDRVASLIDKSLLQQTEQEGDEPRLVMLETIREFGLECLAASGEAEVTQRAHAEYYLALVEAAELEPEGQQQAVWLERLEREQDNFRTALWWLLKQGEAGQGMEMALRLSTALRQFWSLRGNYSESRSFLERALAGSEGAVASVRAKAHYAAARLALVQGDMHSAETHGEESLALYREIGDTAGIAHALHLLADIANVKVDFAGSHAKAEEALVLFRKIGDQENVAYVLTHLAKLAIDQNEYVTARTILEESLALYQELRNESGIAESLFTLARVSFLTQDDLAKVDTLLEESFVRFSKLGEKQRIAFCYSFSAAISLKKGDAPTADQQVQKAVALFREMKHQEGMTVALVISARVAASQGDYATARTLFEESLALAMVAGDKRYIASGLERLASIVASQGEFAWAAQLWGAAEALREAICAPLAPVERASYKRAVAATHTQLGEAAFAVAWAQGRTMTPEQVLAVQGQEIASAPTTIVGPPSPSYPAGLTAREVGVLRLVAKGLTNSEIAEELGLSEKTIAHHLTHIFNKTTSENRAAAAAFAIRHNLA